MSLLWAVDVSQADSLSDFTNYFGATLVGSNGSIAADANFYGGYCLQFTSANATKGFRYGFVSDQAGKTIFPVVHFKSSTIAAMPIFRIFAASTTEQCCLMINASGYLEVRSYYSAGTLLATGTKNVLDGAVNVIKAEILVANSGTFKVYVNNILDINLTATDTQRDATNSVSAIEIISTTTGNTNPASIAHVIIYNSDGSVNNALPSGAPCILGSFKPNADSSNDWTLSTGATAYTLIDDNIGAPNDADYVSDNVSGHRCECDLADMAINPSAIHAVVVNTRLGLDTSGTVQTKHGVNINGTRFSTTVSPGTGAANFLHIQETSDGGTTAITKNDFNAMKVFTEVV